MAMQISISLENHMPHGLPLYLDWHEEDSNQRAVLTSNTESFRWKWPNHWLTRDNGCFWSVPWLHPGQRGNSATRLGLSLRASKMADGDAVEYLHTASWSAPPMDLPAFEQEFCLRYYSLHNKINCAKKSGCSAHAQYRKDGNTTTGKFFMDEDYFKSLNAEIEALDELIDFKQWQVEKLRSQVPYLELTKWSDCSSYNLHPYIFRNNDDLHSCGALSEMFQEVIDLGHGPQWHYWLEEFSDLTILYRYRAAWLENWANVFSKTIPRDSESENSWDERIVLPESLPLPPAPPPRPSLEQVAAKKDAMTEGCIYTPKEVAEYLKITEATLNLWRRRGLIHWMKFGSRIRYVGQDVLTFIEKEKR